MVVSDAQSTNRAAQSRYRRLRSALYYFGAGVIPGRATARERDAFERHHRAQSQSFFGMLMVAWIAATLDLVIDGITLFNFPVSYKWFSSTLVLPVIHIGVLVGLAGLWCSGWIAAARGRMNARSLLSRLARRPVVPRLGRIGGPILLVCTSILAGLTIHASTLTRSNMAPAKVYMLYDDMGVAPHFVFDLGFYRIAIIANERWGAGSVVVAPLNAHSFSAALHQGEFVFVASHGEYGFVNGPDASYVPQGSWSGGNPQLKLVYLAACEAGLARDDWERSLAPARVISFNRLSWIPEHIWWLWVDGPGEVAKLPP